MVVISVVVVVLLLAAVVSVASRVGQRWRNHPVNTAGSPTPAATQGRTTPSPAVSPPTDVPSSAVPTAPAPAAAVPLSAAAIAALIDPAVVDVNAIIGRTGTAAGTGMVLSDTGEILTNNHVIVGASRISVQIAGTGPSFAATIVNSSVAEDVALLQLQGASNLKTIPTGDSSKVAVGDRVVALGNALGRAGPPSVSQGVVVALGQSIIATDPTAQTSEALNGLIQVNARLQPGDSGGPLVNAFGQVVGMNTAASSRMRFDAANAVGFAIPINTVLSIAARLREGAKAGSVVPSPIPPAGPPGFLGVKVQDAATSGALVIGVVAGSPAASAGLATGDVITSIDRTAVGTATDLTSILRAHQPGDAVRLAWVDVLGLRHGATVRLATVPAT